MSNFYFFLPNVTEIIPNVTTVLIFFEGYASIKLQIDEGVSKDARDEHF